MATLKANSSRVSFASLTPNNLGTVRKLNSVLFPIKYTEKFYEGILSPDVENFCKLVYYNDIPVGTICCRFEEKDGQVQLYLMTMGVLAPYRSRGLGSQTLQLILDAAASHAKPIISKIYLHVQTSNTEAKQFYEKHGFKEVGLHENYYKKIVPHDAWILEKAVEH
ncbi:N-acetyltransferase 5 [Stygiomarasmius scandens]|uniref:N-acetyltransferase 5 n=1 Tax=Marasmiellus scandens TaxID=2682957 RepID=A0ABR1KAH1_9AGAR